LDRDIAKAKTKLKLYLKRERNANEPTIDPVTGRVILKSQQVVIPNLNGILLSLDSAIFLAKFLATMSKLYKARCGVE
jgi:hypothetical protein